ncbi:MAG TPA: adenylyl-sulfate kinase [Euzebya sp.]|nr:adenylyl-sulfate kinase [Euzebya sp.]
MPDPAQSDAPTSTNIVRATGHVDPATRRQAMGHGAATVWFTGLSGSGKSTIAHATEAALVQRGVAAFVLDGDNVRFGLNADLGFSPEDRSENIRRVAHVSRLMHDAGIIVLASFISPYRADRAGARDLHPDGGFLEVFVDTPIEVCEARDVKGLYAKARAGTIPNLSGVSAPFEAPEAPDLRLDTSTLRPEDCVAAVLDALTATGVLPRG